MRTVLDQTQEFVELAFFDHVNCVTVFTLDFNLAFDKQALKKKLLTRATSIFVKWNSHTAQTLTRDPTNVKK